jgi:phage shock protein A
LVRANLNDLIRKAEDPAKIIQQALDDMRSALRQARIEVANAMAEQMKLQREQESYAQQAQAWQEKAAEALKAGREDLAREALKRKVQAQNLADGFAQQIAQQSALVEQLKTQLKALEAKIEEAESKKALLLARQRGVEAAEAVRRMGSVADAHPAVEAFQEMEQRVNEMEDRHKALSQLDHENVEQELASLGQDKAVEEDLAKLKQQLGL